jgi:glycosyltransferase involved in cell wall biosynthesis
VTILYFADIRFPLERANGIQTMETCHALGRRGHHVNLVVRPDTQKPARDPFAFYGLPRIHELRIESAPVAGPPLARRAGYLVFAAGRAIGTGRADIVITRDLGLASSLLRFPRTFRPPLVYESHGYAPLVSEALPALVVTAQKPGGAKLARLRKREERVWRMAEGYIAITRGLADALRELFGERSALAVVPDGTRIPKKPANTPDDGHAATPGARPFVVAYAGHLYPWKGVDVLLEALARVPNVSGLIVGGHQKEPDLARAQRLAEQLGISTRVTFTGLVPPTRVAEFLRGADVLVLPNPTSAISTRFTSPLKLFEYMAAQRPIVASDLPAVREVVEHERTALLVPAGNPDALASAIGRLRGDPALRQKLSGAAAEAVADFTWDRRAERIEGLLHRVVENRG